MTLWASRDGQKVTIHGNLGLDVKVQDSRVAEYAINEDLGQMRALWGSLGRLIEEADVEAAPPVHVPEPGGF